MKEVNEFIQPNKIKPNEKGRTELKWSQLKMKEKKKKNEEETKWNQGIRNTTNIKGRNGTLKYNIGNKTNNYPIQEINIILNEIINITVLTKTVK